MHCRIKAGHPLAACMHGFGDGKTLALLESNFQGTLTNSKITGVFNEPVKLNKMPLATHRID